MSGSYRLSPKDAADVKSNLSQCPCCPATKCLMDESCLGCETYSQWLEKNGKCEACGKDRGVSQFNLCYRCFELPTE